MQIDEEYFKSEDFQEILRDYEASIEAGSYPFMDADDLVDLADYYSWQGDIDKATEAIDHALSLYPDATLPNVFMARLALEEENFEEARSYAARIGHQDDPDYHYLLAEIMIAEGDPDGADRYLRDYSKTVSPDEQEDYVRDCANLFIDYGLSDKAYEWLMRSKGDGSDDFKELMARALFGVGKYKDCERLFNELIDQHPFSTRYWTALASAQLMDEDYSGAIASAEYAIAIDPKDPDALNDKATGLLRLGNHEEALKYYQRYTELIADDEYGWLQQGICLVNLGRYEEARTVLENALACASEDSFFLVQIYQELAFCYGSLHDVDRALEMLDKTEELDCDHLDMLVVRGHILLQNQQVKRAEETFKQAILQSDSAPKIMLRIIVSLYDNHYLLAAYEMLQTFLALTHKFYPDFDCGDAYMALCCYDLRYKEEFLKYLKLTVEKNPAEAQNVLGQLFPEGLDVSEYVPYMEKRLSAK